MLLHSFPSDKCVARGFIILDSAGPHQDLTSCQLICNLLYQINHVCMYVCMDGPFKVTSNLWDSVIPKYDIACTIEVIVRDVDKYDLKVLSLPVDIL